MAFEKRWAVVPTQILIANGTADGQLSIANAFQLKVKQNLLLKSNSQPTIQVQVKRVVSKTIFYVGKPSEGIDDRVDVSAYLTSDSASISNPDGFQPRPKISKEDFQRAVYEEEPTVAVRSLLVDRGGNPVAIEDNGSLDVIDTGKMQVGPWDELAMQYDLVTQDMTEIEYKLGGNHVATYSMDYDEFSNLTSFRKTS